MEEEIRKSYDLWADTLNDDEEADNPFIRSSEWKGDMVLAFMKYHIKRIEGSKK